ncbi:serine/threonine-protein kinase [Nocardiopsis deserti]|uniref:serine/threonine-protein kinase n=1 Tax=Nocardiopsis deserti TaxID=2605988 RepID=UPI001239F29F|nr:serine/threonine-protein kinase [Nocardiopsis deserti]
MTSPEPPSHPSRSAQTFQPLRPRDPESVGGYRTVGRLGAGGMGTVYAGRGASGGVVAIKLVHGDLAADPDFRARFRREADLVRRVSSACVPRFLDSDTDAAQPWLATEYVAGPTLRQHVREHGPLTGTSLRAFATGVSEALRAIHTAGIVHRDLKPGNVVLAADGPKVLDFGIARALAETAITRTGGLFGTPGWVAPELLRGGQPSPAADVFAWGALVAFAATGRNPFGTGSAETVAVRVLDGQPDLAGIPDDLMPLVTAATGGDPARRPTVDQALSELLGAQLTGIGGTSPAEEATALVTRVLRDGWEAPPPPTMITPPRPLAPTPGTGQPSDRAAAREPGKRRWTLVAAAAAAVLLVTGGGWFLGVRFGPGGTGSGADRTDAAGGTEGSGRGSGGNGDGPGEGSGEVSNAGAGGEIAVEISGNGLFTVHADGSGGLGITPGFDGVNPALPEGVERAEYAVATVRVETVYSDTAAQTGIMVFGEVEYVADTGEFTLRSGDITLLEVGEGLDPLPRDPTADGRPAHVAVPDEVLATVSRETPSAEFEVRFPEAPESGLLAYLPAPTALGGNADTARGAYACYMNWHPYPPVDMTDEEFVPCPEERPSE